ncbi:hypothetical protein [Streptomyces werraensis]|uniref:hypothetical protein n=1 Tax=Streptomyces werraensis TaxID=68284 RepID=UPI0034333EC9
MTEVQTDVPEVAPAPLTSFRVTWQQKGNEQSRTETCIVNADDMTRPGDPEQRNDLIRRMLAIRYLPIGYSIPENIVLLDVQPICNCEPYPGEDCAYAHHGGERFFLTTAREPGFEWITDRHDNKAVGLVLNTLSVDFLTVVRNRYGHQ